MNVKCLGSVFMWGAREEINIRIRISQAVFWKVDFSGCSVIWESRSALLNLIK